MDRQTKNITLVYVDVDDMSTLPQDQERVIVKLTSGYVVDVKYNEGCKSFDYDNVYDGFDKCADIDEVECWFKYTDL